MTAPAIWAGTDLDSITFSDEEPGEACEMRHCGAEAVCRGIFVPLLDCPHSEPLYCLACKDYILAEAADSELFLCPDCEDGGSRQLLRFVRMEPLR